MSYDYKQLIQQEYYPAKNVRDDIQHLSVPELIALSDADRLPFSVAIINLFGDLNTATIIRSACLLGAKRVLVFGRNKIDNRGLVGAQHYIDIHKYPGMSEDLTIDPLHFMRALDKYGLTPVFAETGQELLGSFSWNDRLNDIEPCLVFGNESRGIDPRLVQYCQQYYPGSFNVSVAQRGVMRSLNVSAAAAILMHSVSQFYA